MRASITPRLRRFVVGTLLIAAFALGGCQAVRPVPPPADLQLMDSAPLVLEPSCRVAGMVRVEYTVLRDGRTRGVRIFDAPECAKDALAAWVASYRYAPPSRELQTQFEWMLVSAERGS